MRGLDFALLKSVYNKKGYSFFDGGRFNINLFGIRDIGSKTDDFNDMLGMAYLDDFNRPNVLLARGTTKPGLYLKGTQGTFVLREGYYKKAFRKGKILRSDCLVQNSYCNFLGFRDFDKNGMIDLEGTVYENRHVPELNFHTPVILRGIEKLEAYAYGCQMLEDYKDHLIFLSMAHKSMDIYGTCISYALFNVKDFFHDE